MKEYFLKYYTVRSIILGIFDYRFFLKSSVEEQWESLLLVLNSHQWLIFYHVFSCHLPSSLHWRTVLCTLCLMIRNFICKMPVYFLLPLEKDSKRWCSVFSPKCRLSFKSNQSNLIRTCVSISSLKIYVLFSEFFKTKRFSQFILRYWLLLKIFGNMF